MIQEKICKLVVDGGSYHFYQIESNFSLEFLKELFFEPNEFNSLCSIPDLSIRFPSLVVASSYTKVPVSI